MSIAIKPMTTDRVGPMVVRGYRDGSRFQWARETAINAEEAGATRVDYTVEPQGVALGVYRRLIVDNGKGMDSDELERFFNTFGGGGKPIGGEHENFGIGAKTSLLPWNKLGVVVVSRKDGDTSMIRIVGADDGEYGLEQTTVIEDDGVQMTGTVMEPYEDEAFGIDWSKVLPDWIEDHGTAIVLFGNTPGEDTIRNDPDPNLKEGGYRALLSYFNERLWAPKALVNVIELDNWGKKHLWTKDFSHGRGKAKEYGYIIRSVTGVQTGVSKPTGPDQQVVEGTVDVGEGVSINWYLWNSAVSLPVRTSGPTPGFSVLYKDELYDWTTGFGPLMLTAGVWEKTVADRLYLVARPPMDAEPTKETRGVYPRSDRSKLAWSGGKDVPVFEWAATFAKNMPQEIIDALKAARKTQPGVIDDKWKQRLAAQFSARLKIKRFKLDENGKLTASSNVIVAGPSANPAHPLAPVAPVTPGVLKPHRRRKKRPSTPTFVAPGNTSKATAMPMQGDLPDCEFSDTSVASDDSMAVIWMPPNPQRPSGLIRIWRDHPVVQGVFAHFEKDYHTYGVPLVRQTIEECYCAVMACRLAHSEEMAKAYSLDTKTVEAMRSSASLTMSLLGLCAEDAIIKRELSKALGRKVKHPVAAAA